MFRCANTNQVRCLRLLMRGFQFRSVLYSERCAHEPRKGAKSNNFILHELTQKNIAEDSESDIAICFVNEND